MSFLFNGTSSTLELGAAVASVAPLTLACRTFPASTGTAQTFLSLCSSSSVSGDLFRIFATNTGSVRYIATQGGSSGQTGGVTIQASRWSSVVGIERSATSRLLIVNGAQGAVNATNITPSGVNRTNASAHYINSALTAWTNGLLADVAIWSNDLSIPEAMAFCGGTPPDQIRPATLVLYLPLDRDSFDRSMRGSLLTNTAAVANSNAPFPYTPNRRKFFMTNSVAASGLIINPMIGPVDMQRFAA